MTELVVAALTVAVVIYGVSAAAKLRSRQAYRAFRAGLAATTLVGRPLTGLVAVALAGAEAVVAALCAAALIMALSSGPGAVAGPALGGAAALAAMLTAGVAVSVHRGVAEPCACFGSRGRQPLSGVHVTRNACLLVILAAGAIGTHAAHWPGRPASAALAATAGGVVAVLLSRLDDLTALFGMAAR
ncbi:MAG TPA: MauE/DoxX family redox-associated membrane protein [Streptosporangiaceae bacterium]|nr:MauE/DoxX family redox-associated membrane protein [Streptosporangiaceae bacterium]